MEDRDHAARIGLVNAWLPTLIDGVRERRACGMRIEAVILAGATDKVGNYIYNMLQGRNSWKVPPAPPGAVHASYCSFEHEQDALAWMSQFCRQPITNPFVVGPDDILFIVAGYRGTSVVVAKLLRSGSGVRYQLNNPVAGSASLLLDAIRRLESRN